MNLLLPNYYILLIFVSSILHTILDKGKFRSTKDGSYIFFVLKKPTNKNLCLVYIKTKVVSKLQLSYNTKCV